MPILVPAPLVPDYTGESPQVRALVAAAAAAAGVTPAQWIEGHLRAEFGIADDPAS